MYAIGGNESAASVAGVNVPATLIRIYFLASMLYGLAGFLVGAMTMLASNFLFSQGPWTPFQMFAAPWMEAEKLAGNLNRLNVPGVIFRPMYLKPFYSVGKGELLQGVQVHIMDFGKAPLSDLQFLVMQEVAALYPDRAVFDHADKGRFNMFDKVSGSRQIRERFSKRNRWEDIRDYWYKDAEDFRKLSKKYYLYK
jgi:uncharacterized protein YbbC (DUF1343 family)